jgi:hypothetical protein
VKVSAWIALAALLCGCAVKKGRCYPIMGLGFTTVNTNQPGVRSTETMIVGLGAIGPPVRFILGFGRVSVTEIDTSAVVEIK